MASHLALVSAADLRPRLIALAPCCPVTGTECPHAPALPVRVGEIIAAARHTATGPEARDSTALARLLAGLTARAENDPGALAA